MLVLFTDYGINGPYVGQVRGALHALLQGVPVVDLMHDVPQFNAHAGAHLLDALKDAFPVGTVFVCVVDPGVGSDRAAVVVEADGRFYVGPDNGLLSLVAARAVRPRLWTIRWRPRSLSGTFHGRDLFAPVAARIAASDFPMEWLDVGSLEVSFDISDLSRIIYIDDYGNAWTGLRGAGLPEDNASLSVRGRDIHRKNIYSDVGKGEAFWYVNSAGLVEIAANRASAAQLLGLTVGDLVRLSGSPESRLH